MAKQPSREETDKLAEKFRGQKDWKGDDLDEVGQRFYGLRESGYTGAFDWTTGYPGDESLFEWAK
jgi:hypothetical protein